jgi:hypothetical protein
MRGIFLYRYYFYEKNLPAIVNKSPNNHSVANRVLMRCAALSIASLPRRSR